MIAVLLLLGCNECRLNCDAENACREQAGLSPRPVDAFCEGPLIDGSIDGSAAQSACGCWNRTFRQADCSSTEAYEAAADEAEMCFVGVE